MRLAFWFCATSAVLATAAMAACSSFHGSSASTDGDAGAGDAGATDATITPPSDAGPGLDATTGVDAGCMELALSGGTANSSVNDSAITIDGGVEIHYAAGAAATEDAYFEYVIPTPSGSKGLSIEIDCTINSSNKAGDWYLNVAGVTNGAYNNGSSVFFVLAGSSNAPSLDVDAFLLGNPTPNAGSFVMDNTAILNPTNMEKLFLNVEWTTADGGTPVAVSLGGTDNATLAGPTLAVNESIASTTNLHLGDYASAGTTSLPSTMITFTRACISFY